MVKIFINHIARMEGHAGFVASILKGDVKRAKIETQEGARLIEGILLGRNYADAPIITSRICGICPVIHNITSIKALETALGIEIGIEVKYLRELMLAGQVIHSHGLHLFFLSLPDFLDIEDDIKLVKKYQKETEAAIRLRDFGNKIIEVVGGRTIHPISSEVGGFKKRPTLKELNGLKKDYSQVLEDALMLFGVFKKIKYPLFKRETEYICLGEDGRYPLYDGDIIGSKGLRISKEKFYRNIEEIEKPYEAVKRADWQGESFMVGALARLYNNHRFLNKEAGKAFEKTKKELMNFNSFYNILAQSIEIIHFIEEARKLLDLLLAIGPEGKNAEVTAREGRGVAACEAPRGTLYHYYELDGQGRITFCNIITPTAQFLNNLEDDLKEYLPDILELTSKNRKRKIRALIRAYDPCISCATH